MMKLAQLRNYLLPAGIAIGLAIVAGWFYQGWLPSQQKYLDARNFRLLTTLSDQIGASIANFDKMMDNAADSSLKAKEVQGVAGSLENVDEEDVENASDEYHDPPRIMVRADEGSHFLYFAYRRQQADKPTDYRPDKKRELTGIAPRTFPEGKYLSRSFYSSMEKHCAWLPGGFVSLNRQSRQQIPCNTDSRVYLFGLALPFANYYVR